jgi:hypothetical protein
MHWGQNQTGAGDVHSVNSSYKNAVQGHCDDLIKFSVELSAADKDKTDHHRSSNFVFPV